MTISPVIRRRAQRTAIIAIVACATIAALFGTLQVKRHHELVGLSYSLSAITDELRVAEEDNRRLRLERSLLTAPSRIERMATELGLVHPEPKQIRVISSKQRELASR